MKHTDIINQIKMGQHNNVYRLYKHYTPIKKWLVQHGCRPEDTKDIYQEALMVFCTKCKKEGFEMTASIQTYLTSIAKYLFFSKIRRDQKMETVDLSGMEQVVEADVLDFQQKEAEISNAAKALKAISENCRKVLTLFYIQKQSMAKIAEYMGYRSENVAKNQKYKCLNLAREKALAFAQNQTK